MIDPVPENILSSIFIEVFKTGIKGFFKTGEWFAGKTKKVDFFGKAAKRYSQKLNDRHSYIRIIGMEKPIPLRHLFVRVNILDKITSRVRISIKSLEDQFDCDRRGFGFSRATISGIELVNKKNFCIDRSVKEILKKKKLPKKVLELLSDSRIHNKTIKGTDDFLLVLY